MKIGVMTAHDLMRDAFSAVVTHSAGEEPHTSIHGLQGDELRLIRQLIRQNGEHSRFLFLSPHGRVPGKGFDNVGSSHRAHWKFGGAGDDDDPRIRQQSRVRVGKRTDPPSP